MTTTPPEVTTGIASQSGHWYLPDGTPAYEVPKARGGMRPATLRDARKLGLFPSVTGVIKEAANWGLVNWGNDKLLETASEHPIRDDETLQAWIERVKYENAVKLAAAPDRGTAIHAAIEQMFEGRPVEAELAPYAIEVVEWIDREYPGWAATAEKSFAHPGYGYGGKIDLVLVNCEETVIIDFKTTDKDVDTARGYDSHVMQLAACREGIDSPDATVLNLFVSSTEPGRIRAYPWHEDRVNQAWKMFESLLSYWKWSRNYFPGRAK